MNRSVIAILAVLGVLETVRAAESRYVLETKSGVNAAPIAAKFGLTLGRCWQDDRHEACAVSSATPLTAATIKSILSENGVLELETDAELLAPEAEHRSIATLEPLNEQLELRQTIQYFGCPVRESYVYQPATRLMGLLDAQRRYGTGAPATVAIIDTGVDPRHPALADVLLPGYDFTRDLPGTANELADLDQSTVAILDQSTVAILDTKQTPVRLNQSTVAILDQSTVAILDTNKLPAAFGHGTMLAGLVHLIAPQARILPLKAFRADGSSTLSEIVRAIYYAADHGATVISMSFSMSTSSPELERAVAYAVSKGAICVASAGNEGKSAVLYPAGLKGVIGVGSTNYSDRRSPFSNHGGSVRTSAPGEAVITTYPGNHYAGAWGTSFSTAEVAGAVALIQQIRLRAKFDDVKNALDHGAKISQGMGDARLFLPASLQYCQKK